METIKDNPMFVYCIVDSLIYNNNIIFVYDKSSRPGKDTWTCINKELGLSFHHSLDLEFSHTLRIFTRACAILEERV